MWTLEIVFERQKTSAEGHSQTLTQSDLVLTNPGIYIYIYIILCLSLVITNCKAKFLSLLGFTTEACYFCLDKQMLFITLNYRQSENNVHFDNVTTK